MLPQVRKEAWFKDFFSQGLVFALIVQAVFLLLFIPTSRQLSVKDSKSQIFFLGSILKEGDFSFSRKNFSGVDKKFSISGRTDLLKKVSVILPKPFIAEEIFGFVDKASNLDTVGARFAPESEISFGFWDFSRYLSGVDFSDLKKNSLRDDVGSNMVFDVLIGKAGKPRYVKKELGSGDPLFDFYVMLKLKGAVFKTFMTRENFRLKINFKIK